MQCQQCKRETNYLTNGKCRVCSYPRHLRVTMEVYPGGVRTGNSDRPVTAAAYAPRSRRIRIRMFLRDLRGRLRLSAMRYDFSYWLARQLEVQGQWVSIAKGGVSLALDCTVPKCGTPGIWDLQTGWLCKKHHDLGPRVWTEIRKAYPHVGVNGPGIWNRLPQAKDARKTAWLQLRFSNFGLVELPGWIG